MTQPWSAPDARPEERAAAPPGAGVVESVQPDVPLPVPLRPMTVADVLDGGIAVIKAAPRTVFVIAAVLVVPLELVSAWVQRDTLADRGIAGAISAATSSSDSSDVTFTASTLVLILLSGIVLSFVTGAIAALITSWYAGTPLTAGDAVRASLRHAPALIAAFVIVHLAEAVAAVALIIPAVLVMPLFLAVAPAIVVERLGPWAGVRRSWSLTRVRYSAVLGAAILIALVSTLLTIALSGLGLAFSFLSFGWVIDVACRGASSLVTVPFVAASTTLVYLDLRIRAEGLDLELDIAEHFASAR